MREQRNAYKGLPLRSWIRVVLVAPDGDQQELELIADTGNPYPIIVGKAALKSFRYRRAPKQRTNFGMLSGGWVAVSIPDLAFNEVVAGYGSDSMLAAVRASSSDFDGLAGLPLLRMLEYGGDNNSFWLRAPGDGEQSS